MWMLVHPENPIVWTLHWNEIFIAKTYWFSAWRLLWKDIVQVGSFVGIIQTYLERKKKKSVAHPLPGDWSVAVLGNLL